MLPPKDVHVGRQVIPLPVCRSALRRLYVDVLEHGLPAETLREWIKNANHFPHLRDSPEITALIENLPDELLEGVLCEPQILVAWPHTGESNQITWHTDVEPPWADNRRYVRIVGVPLSPWNPQTGGLIVRNDPFNYSPILYPGDLIVMGPHVEHSGGFNRSPTPRFGVYFRWLSFLKDHAEQGER